MRGCGRIERPAFPAPSDLQMAHQSKTRALMRGEIANAWLQTTALLQTKACLQRSPGCKRISHSTQDNIETCRLNWLEKAE